MQNKEKYNPRIHHRRSIRLKGYDYAQAGVYFITICCQDRKYRFGKIVNREMVLNNAGIIAHDQWLKLTERFPKIELGVFQIMPNHMHGIIIIDVRATLAVAPIARDNANDVGIRAVASPANTDVRATLAVAPDARDNANDVGIRAVTNPAPTNKTVGDIVGAYKSLVANACLHLFKSGNETMGKLWQRNYYEHIVRNEKSHQTISDYIVNNAYNWIEDKFFMP